MPNLPTTKNFWPAILAAVLISGAAFSSGGVLQMPPQPLGIPHASTMSQDTLRRSVRDTVRAGLNKSVALSMSWTTSLRSAKIGQVCRELGERRVKAGPQTCGSRPHLRKTSSEIEIVERDPARSKTL